MQTFSEQPSRQTRLPPPPPHPKTASHMPVSFKTSISFEIFTIRPQICTRVPIPFLKDADFLDDFSVNATNPDVFKISFSMFFCSGFSRQYFY